MSRLDLLAFLCPELLGTVIKELLVHLHEQFQCIVDQAMDRPAMRGGLARVTSFTYLDKHRDCHERNTM